MNNEIETETLKEARRMIVRVLKAEGFTEVAEQIDLNPEGTKLQMFKRIVLDLEQSGAKAEISVAVEAKYAKFIPEPAEPSWDHQKSNPETGAAAKSYFSLIRIGEAAHESITYIIARI